MKTYLLLALATAAPVFAADAPRPAKTGDSTTQTKHADEAPGFLGVQLDEVDEALTYHLGLANDLGVMVTGVAPGKAGDTMGLKRFDVIIAAGETPIYTPRALSDFIRSKKAGDQVTLTVRRGATSVDLSGALDARPAEIDGQEGPHRFHQWPGPGPITGPGGQRRGVLPQPDGSTMEWSIDESPEPPGPRPPTIERAP